MATSYPGRSAFVGSLNGAIKDELRTLLLELIATEILLKEGLRTHWYDDNKEEEHSSRYLIYN